MGNDGRRDDITQRRKQQFEFNKHKLEVCTTAPCKLQLQQCTISIATFGVGMGREKLQSVWRQGIGSLVVAVVVLVVTARGYCGQGYYQGVGGSCYACNPGFYCGDGLTQTPCPAGKYQQSYYQTDPNSCYLCNAGTFAAGTNTTYCSYCPAGKYGTTTGATACTNCTGGYQLYQGQTYCTACDVGYYAPTAGATSSTDCQYCPAGRYGDVQGLSACFGCPGGKYANYAYGANSVGYCYQCYAGTYAPANNTSPSCISCPAGRTNPSYGQSSCLPCDAGTYTASTGSTADPMYCTTCGYYQTSDPGMSSCYLCPLGRYGDTYSGICHPCNPGSMSTSTGSSYCQQYCSPGTYADGSGNMTACGNCPAGKYSMYSAASSCTACSPGYYQSSAGQTFCTYSCAVGTYSLTGASTCPNCPPGNYSQYTGSSTCTPCSAGYYQGLSGQTYCNTGCSPGYYSQQGASACSPCPAGTYYPSTSASSCYPCSAGYYSTTPAMTSSCTLYCSPGTYSLAGSTACTACLAGTYQSSYYGSSCPNCNAGYYSAGPGAISCQGCTGGSFSTAGSSSCTGCAAGKYAGGSASQCTACSLGYVAPASSASCTGCTPGTYGSAGASSCAQCPAGTASSAYYASSCSPCPNATYTSTTGQQTCQPCPIGQGSSGGATQCNACPIGSYSNTSGMVCTQCSSGTFGNSTGMSFCYSCNGQFSLPGSSSCSSCVAGYYMIGTSCLACNVGTYNPYAIASSCIACSAGAATFGRVGASKCDLCSTGTFNNQSGQDQCGPCYPGSYAGNQGATVCTLCSPGTYAANFSQTTCQTCPAGSASFFSGATSCFGCQPGTYSIGSGCLQCPAGRTSYGNGMSTCVSCSVGYYGSNGNCSHCSSGSTTNQEASTLLTDCICPVGYYGKAYAGEACITCPQSANGFTCSVSNISLPWLVAGYYRSQTNPLLAFSCTPSQSCLETGDSSTTSCATGYMGDICGDCWTRWYRSGSLCEQCPGVAALVLTVLGLILFLCLVVFILIRRGFELSSDLRVLITWVQILSTFPNISSSWPTALYSFFQALSLSNLDINIVSPQCTLGTSFFKLIYLKLFLPLVFWIILMTMFLVNAFITSGKVWATALRKTTGKAESYFVLVVTSLYTMIVSTLISPFQCQQQPDGSSTLVKNPSTYCYQGDWNQQIAGVIIFMILYLLAFPLILIRIFVLIQKNPEMAQRYRYLTKNYKPHARWYELVSNLKKTLLVITTSFLAVSSNSEVKYFAAVIVLISFLLFEILVNPYNDYALLRLSMIWSLAVLLILLASGLVFSSTTLSDSQKDGIGITFILIIVGAVVYVIVSKVCRRRRKIIEADLEVDVKGVELRDGKFWFPINAEADVAGGEVVSARVAFQSRRQQVVHTSQTEAAPTTLRGRMGTLAGAVELVVGGLQTALGETDVPKEANQERHDAGQTTTTAGGPANEETKAVSM